jgi:hypothetical protein
VCVCVFYFSTFFSTFGQVKQGVGAGVGWPQASSGWLRRRLVTAQGGGLVVAPGGGLVGQSNGVHGKLPADRLGNGGGRRGRARWR